MALPAGRKGVLPSELTPEGKIKNSASPYVLPTASAETLGGIKVGSGLSINEGVLSATQYSLPTASDETLGGVKVGSGLAINEGVLSALSQAPTLTNITTLIDTDRFASCDIYYVDFGTFCLVSGNFGTKSSISDAGWREVATLPSVPSKNIFIAGVAGFVDSSKQACDVNLLATDNGVLKAYVDSNNRDERYCFTFIYIKGGE